MGKQTEWEPGTDCLEQSPETGFFPDQYEETPEFEDEGPYCECDENADEEEQAFNQCKACGKPIWTEGAQHFASI